MGSFLDELLTEIDSCPSNDNSYVIEKIRGMVNSLGTNACRMLDIGILQDKLIELGFKVAGNCPIKSVLYYGRDDIVIQFEYSFCIIKEKHQPPKYFYSAHPEFHVSVLDKVKEIMGYVLIGKGLKE